MTLVNAELVCRTRPPLGIVTQWLPGHIATVCEYAETHPSTIALHEPYGWTFCPICQKLMERPADADSHPSERRYGPGRYAPSAVLFPQETRLPTTAGSFIWTYLLSAGFAGARVACAGAGAGVRGASTAFGGSSSAGASGAAGAGSDFIDSALDCASSKEPVISS